MRECLTILACLFCPLAYGGVPDDPAKAMPLETGQPVPSVELRTVDGETVDLSVLADGQPSIFIFYRGSWCPYCNKHLASLGDVQDDLKALGYQMLAISPDKPEGLKEAAESNKLSYTLLSDSSAEAAKAFGLAFKVGLATRTLYRGYGINLEEASGEDHHILPIPAVYLTDAEGIIQYKYANTDYKVRLSAEELLKAAEKNAATDEN
ncbi:AhpC/TSA family protein [Puniceicoccales bacterium CK1056]|uniref:thioredoxin-dependent peroxiredoxin n=1 Tax=Oceanipulchritudo coccoides TaxID=2706888 RepID=A0A6B2M2Y1_9BACT|nr:peroxiredoxin-like family protein [Oceanipulchritudo coccoides]NDV63318.1 AhpC/TSA family protein [Oceanipulchritudo coccoides]